MSKHETKCNACGFTGDLDEFDVCGACPGSLHCNNCGIEFVSETGDPSLLCGECTGCEWLKEAEEFEEVKVDRERILAKFREKAK